MSTVNPARARTLRTLPRAARAALATAAIASAQLGILPYALAACRGTGDAHTRRTLIDSRDSDDPRSLDPALSTDVSTGRAVAYVFDGLVRFTPDAKVEPALAARWDVSRDGLQYVFHLRHGVKFHDGRPFSARHVVHSFERVLSPTNRGGRPWPLYPIRGAREVTAGTAAHVAGLSAPNDSTVVITLAEPLAIFPKLLAMPVAAIVPDSVSSTFGEHPVGTGPWKFVEWQHDDYLRFVANRDYFGGPPSIDTLQARIIREPSTAEAEFESGNVDILAVPLVEANDWELDAEKRPLLQTAPGLQMIYVAINVTHGPLADARVRQALNVAVDTRRILERVLGGRGRLAAGVVPAALEGADTARAPYRFDSLKARALLSAAGYPRGLSVDLWTSSGAPFPRIAETLQAYLATAGVRVKIVQRDAPSVRAAAQKGTPDLVLKTWYADYPDAENFLYPLLHSSNRGPGGNVSFYANATFDSLVAAARREQDSAHRAALYREADSLAFEEAPMIFLFFPSDLFATQPWIKNFRVPMVFNGQPLTEVRIEP